MTTNQLWVRKNNRLHKVRLRNASWGDFGCRGVIVYTGLDKKSVTLGADEAWVLLNDAVVDVLSRVRCLEAALKLLKEEEHVIESDHIHIHISDFCQNVLDDKWTPDSDNPGSAEPLEQ